MTTSDPFKPVVPSAAVMTPERTRKGSTPDFRVLPSVDALRREIAARHAWPVSESLALALLAEVVEQARQAIAAGAVMTRQDVVGRAESVLSAVTTPRLQRVVNATGIIVHTNLGRAPLSDQAVAAMAEAAASAIPLELDPETNQRGGRMEEVSRLFGLLTGAEATLVVNNNAAAVMLALSALASGRQVIVSRGEAVEIGGGFRVPDVMRQSGAALVEVGTTNRTYVDDYAQAITPETAALLKVHTSNFRLVGFTAVPTREELAALAHRHGVAVLEDLGSGSLLDTARFGLEHEPTLQEAVKSGIDVVMASGDKLLGGPQAGLLLGKKRWIEQIGRHPLARAVRADKTCLAGLAATLRHYLRGDADQTLPVWQAIGAAREDLAQRAASLAGQLAALGVAVEVVPSDASVGGGSLPGQTLPSVSLRLVAIPGQPIDELARRLRVDPRPPVYARLLDGGLQLDLRTVRPEEDGALVSSLLSVLKPTPKPKNDISHQII